MGRRFTGCSWRIAAACTRSDRKLWTSAVWVEQVVLTVREDVERAKSNICVPSFVEQERRNAGVLWTAEVDASAINCRAWSTLRRRTSTL
jgi:hypothetical protein